MIRVLLVDDQVAVRRGLRKLLSLETDIEVVGAAGAGREAIVLAKRLSPDVVVMDVEMPDLDGIAVAAQLRASSPGAAVVMISIHDDALTRAGARAAGAAGFVSKSAEIESLLFAIRKADQRPES